MSCCIQTLTGTVCLLSGGCIMYTLSCITEAECAEFPSDHSILLCILLWCTEMFATQFIISISSLSRCFYPKCLIVCSIRIKTLTLALLVSCYGSWAMCVLWCDDLNAFPEVPIKRKKKKFCHCGQRTTESTSTAFVFLIPIVGCAQLSENWSYLRLMKCSLQSVALEITFVIQSVLCANESNLKGKAKH